MDVRITEGPFGKSIQIDKATSAQVLEVMAGLVALDVPAPERVEEGRAFVGQTIEPVEGGLRLRDLPKGVKVIDSHDGTSIPILHVSQDGRNYEWFRSTGDRYHEWSTYDESNTLFTEFNGAWVVKEVW